jgi:hypothetical protein
MFFAEKAYHSMSKSFEEIQNYSKRNKIPFNFFKMKAGAVKICRSESVRSRVARWFIFKHKIPIWVNFGGL